MTKKQDSDLICWEEEKIIIQQEKIIKRLSFKTVYAHLASAFNLDKGLFYLMLNLSYKPGPTIKSFLDTGRFNIFSPVKYFLIIIGLSIFISTVTDFNPLQEGIQSTIRELEILDIEEIDQDKYDEAFIADLLKDTESPEFQLHSSFIIAQLERKYKNYFSLFSIILSSLLSWLVFKRSKFNFAEHLAVNTYIYTHIAIIQILATLLKSSHVLFPITELLAFIIMSLFTYKYLFSNNWIKTVISTLIIIVASGYITSKLFYHLTIYYLNNFG